MTRPPLRRIAAPEYVVDDALAVLPGKDAPADIDGEGGFFLVGTAPDVIEQAVEAPWPESPLDEPSGGLDGMQGGIALLAGGLPFVVEVLGEAPESHDGEGDGVLALKVIYLLLTWLRVMDACS